MHIHPLLILYTASLFAACTTAKEEAVADYTPYVNLMIGTGDHGHTHPAAMVPHGMVQPGPDTRIHGWDASSGYHYTDTLLNGFAQTRLSGTGCADYGDFLLMPTTGLQEVKYIGEKEQAQHPAYASPFSHQRETAQPGYYSVWLDRYGIQAEITATPRTALYRFTYCNQENPGCILDLDYNIQEQYNLAMDYEILNDSTLIAHKRTNYWQYRQDLYLRAVFSHPFTCDVVRDTIPTERYPEARCKLLLHFDLGGDSTLLVKLALSSVDDQGAQYNLAAEQPNWDFEGTRQRAHDAWQKALSCIDVETSDIDQKTIFYTALYHAQIAPSLIQDADGRYLGMDLKAHQGEVNDPVYTTFSLWDTFRALHPLLSIIAPHQNEAYIRSLLKKGQEGGLIPKWDCGANYTGCMLGYHAASLIADAWSKGYRDFDGQEALRQLRRCAEYDTSGITPACPPFLYPYIMPVARLYKEQLGYCPFDKDRESVSKGLEYAYDDWCIALLADSLGEKDTADRYYGYSKLYSRYFDPKTRFMRAIDSQGQWREPFDPRSSNHRMDEYCEGNAYQWSWFVLHDIPGLIDLYGGKEEFTARLDSLFSASSHLTGENVSADISGMIGQYAHGNEPSHHIIHLYNYVGHPERTQALVDSVLYSLYSNAPAGLSGNEDCGQMSAWYLFNAMGFYQVCPGRPIYSIGRPIFDRVTLHLDNGHSFIIECTNQSRKDKYIKSMKLNGKELTEPFFTHEQLEKGGILTIQTLPQPSLLGRE